MGENLIKIDRTLGSVEAESAVNLLSVFPSKCQIN